MFKLHPKIKAALIASAVAALIAVGNAAVDAYPQWANILLIFVGALTGYQKKA